MLGAGLYCARSQPTCYLQNYATYPISKSKMKTTNKHNNQFARDWKSQIKNYNMECFQGRSMKDWQHYAAMSLGLGSCLIIINYQQNPIRSQINLQQVIMSQNLKNVGGQRPASPKFSSIGTFSTSTMDNSPKGKGKQIRKGGILDSEQFSFVHTENNRLREENRALRRELNQIKGQQDSFMDLPAMQKAAEVSDLRDTIKKEAGEISDLKTRLEVLTRQCKMYEEAIEKMGVKINKLTEQNKLLESLNQAPKFNPILRKTLQEKPSDIVDLACLKERVTHIGAAYKELEQRYLFEEEQWDAWKQQWALEKTYYLHRIQDLQKMVGIGEPSCRNASKDFFKKKV